jgi:hypothetical protein
LFVASDLEYVELQLALEGIGIDARRRLIRIPASAAEDIPRLYVCRLGSSWARFYRSDVPDLVVDNLDAVSDDTCFANEHRVRSILDPHFPCTDVWAGPSYLIADLPPALSHPEVVRLVEPNLQLSAGLDPGLVDGCRPVYAVIVGGRIVSACVSARENPQAAEAWVQTAPAFRRQGFARHVTAAWARDVLAMGKVAFYSHGRDNVASRAVAASLGARQFVMGVGYL